MRASSFVVLLVWLGGCGYLPWSPGPDRVAAEFWDAVRVGELDRARTLSSRTSDDLLGQWQGRFSIEEIELGEALRNERSAIVNTSLVTMRGEFELRMSFQTHLVREERQWRVDVDRTRQDFAKAAIASAAARVRSAISEGMYELGEALEKGLRELEESLREALEDPEGERSL